MFRIIKGIDDLDFDLFCKNNHYHTTCQDHYKLYPPKSNKKIGQCSFSSRVVSAWNSLPVEFAEAGNVQTFECSSVETPFYLGVFDVYLLIRSLSFAYEFLFEFMSYKFWIRVAFFSYNIYKCC